METTDIRDRIKIIMEKANLNSVSFAEAIGIQQSTLSHILKGRNKPSLDVIMKIHQYFSDINYEWLISGGGEMVMNDDSASFKSQSAVCSSRSSMGGPSLIPVTNNSPSLFDENQENSAKVPSDLNFRRDFAFKTPSEAPKEIVRQEIKYVEKPPIKITEIRIFFDDNTYQIFTCEK